MHKGRIKTHDLDMDGGNLGVNDEEYVGDFDGDGRDEMYIRSNQWAGLVEHKGDHLNVQDLNHGWIDGWNLAGHDEQYVGRFTGGDSDEVLIRSPDWMGLIVWDDSASRLRVKSIQNGWIDGWNLGGTDRNAVDDFDGDGKDEIYIRSNNWARSASGKGESSSSNGSRIRASHSGTTTTGPYRSVQTTSPTPGSSSRTRCGGPASTTRRSRTVTASSTSDRRVTPGWRWWVGRTAR